MYGAAYGYAPFLVPLFSSIDCAIGDCAAGSVDLPFDFFILGFIA